MMASIVQHPVPAHHLRQPQPAPSAGASHSEQCCRHRRHAWGAPTQRHSTELRAAHASAASVLREALQVGRGAATEEAYRAGAEFLRGIGIDSQGEIMRVLDVAMNPNSLFGRHRDKKRAINVNARRLSVEDDMQPVVAVLQQLGLSRPDICKVILEHPPILSYSPTELLLPIIDYLRSLGFSDPAEVVRRRPTLLGLAPDALARIVEYLQANDYTTEQIAEYLQTTL